MVSYFQTSERLYNNAIAGGISVDDMLIVADWPLGKITLLFAAADQVRRHFYGDGVNPCTLMNIKSGGCNEDCAFCTQSAHLRVCSGREKNWGQLQSLIFHAGANGYITGGYLTTPGSGIDENDRMTKSLGLER